MSSNNNNNNSNKGEENNGKGKDKDSSAGQGLSSSMWHDATSDDEEGPDAFDAILEADYPITVDNSASMSLAMLRQTRRMMQGFAAPSLMSVVDNMKGEENKDKDSSWPGLSSSIWHDAQESASVEEDAPDFFEELMREVCPEMADNSATVSLEMLRQTRSLIQQVGEPEAISVKKRREIKELKELMDAALDEIITKAQEAEEGGSRVTG